jgi:homoserine O-acetyltransferase/O-succinyltransferase
MSNSSLELVGSQTASQQLNNETLSEIKFFYSEEALSLESGEELSTFTLAYHTSGVINAQRDNVVWVVHAFTANSDPQEWWPGIVGSGKAIDPSKHFIICVNCLGSHYGSTSPLSVNPQTGKKYYHDFPLITQCDHVKAFDKLRIHLGIEKVKLVLGASLGGQQCLEWSIIKPDVFENQLLIATNAVHSPWGIAFNESQRLAIYADQSWNSDDDNAGLQGMLAARSIALLSYRTYQGYNLTQQEKTPDNFDDFRASSYQRYQGQKLVKRFNAFSYVSLSKSMDSHNVGRHRGSIEKVLSSVKTKTHIIGIDSDILYPLVEQSFLYSHIPNSKFHTISSPLGHDGFLTENDTVSRIIRSILK